MENVSIWTEALDELNILYPDIDWQVYRIKTPDKTLMLFIAHRDGISPSYMDDDAMGELAGDALTVSDIGHQLVDTLEKFLALA